MTNSPAANIESSTETTRRAKRVRWLVRGVLLLAAIWALLWAPHHWRLAAAVPALSPLVGIATLLAVRTLQWTVLLGLAVAVVALVRRRWFCRWVCPVGTCIEPATRLGRRLGRRCPRLPPLGQWTATVTLAAAVIGYPLLVWLDPLAMFAGLFSMTRAGSSAGIFWAAFGMAAVVLLSAVWPGSWCARLCPLGAVQDGLSLVAKWFHHLVPRSKRVPAEAAVRGLPRRTLLGAVLGICWGAVARTARASAERPLRPPGALDEARFAGVCIRCGNCLRACPAKIIQPDQGGHGIASLLTPVLDFREDYCLEDCVRCTEVCPSAALARVALENKQRVSIGVPHVDMDLCLLGDDRDCAVCRNWCPYGAIRLVFSEAEYTLTPQIDLEKCPGCGACQTACPTTPTKAIVIRPG